MINLYETSSKRLVGPITQDQLQFLIDQMEEEGLEDQDYAISSLTLEYLKEQGADSGLLALLALALGDRDEATVRWEDTEAT